MSENKLKFLCRRFWPCWNIVSVPEVNTSIRLLMLEMWCSSPANMLTIYKKRKRASMSRVLITLGGIMWSVGVGGVPAVPGPELRLVGRRCRSAPASHSAEPPLARNHVGGFERTYQIPHTLPAGRGQGESCEWAWVSGHTHTYR